MNIKEIDYYNACCANDFAIIKQCINDKFAMPFGNDQESGFVVACKLGYIEIVKIFMENMPYDNAEDIGYGLLMAIMSNKIEIVNYLLNNYKDKFNLLKDNIPFLYITFNREKYFHILLEHGINFNTENNEPILLEHSFEKSNNDIFRFSLEKSHIEQVEKLIKKMIETNLISNKKSIQKSDYEIHVDSNSNYEILFKYFKSLEEDNLNILKNSCKKYTRFAIPFKKYLTTNAQIFENQIDKALLFYKLEEKIENKKQQMKKNKL